MKSIDRWLLPDGIEEILPEQAIGLERLRRRLVDGFQSWGYDYVIPPLFEFTDSLLAGASEDLSLQTFKFVDQLSGKTLGLRADITPQVARIDAHSLGYEGVTRLCYAGHVAYTRSRSLHGARTPVQAGIELYGASGIEADCEVLSMLLETLELGGVGDAVIAIGHVDIYRSLASAAELDELQQEELFELLQSKAASALGSWLQVNVASPQLRTWLLELVNLSGGIDALERASELFAGGPQALVEAVDSLRKLASELTSRYPTANLYFDLGEQIGYHYHSGIVFAAYYSGYGAAIASGGRYDAIGEAYGRARPATGFAVDLTALCRVASPAVEEAMGIFVPASLQATNWSDIQALRAAENRIVLGIEGQNAPEAHQNCDRIAIEQNGSLQVTSLG